MGRRRKHNRHLPQGMVLKHGAYYLVTRVDNKQKWARLSVDYGDALRRYADEVGKTGVDVLTVRDAMAYYISARCTGKRPLSADTVAGYTQSSKRLDPIFGDLKLNELHREHVYRYVMDAGTVAANRDRALLSATYNELSNRGLFKGPNPAAGLNRRAKETPRERYITDDELEKIIAKMPATVALIVRWAYLTGMRLSDVLRLRISDGCKESVTFAAGKTGKSGTIEFTPALRDVWRAAAGSRIGAQPLFRSSTGNAYTRSGFESVWQRAKADCGVPNLQFKDLRRKAGSDVTLEHATALLQHSDPRTTARHYRAPKPQKPVK